MHQLVYWLLGGLAAAGAAMLVVAVLRWEEIQVWLAQRRANAHLGRLRQILQDGDYVIQAGVFDTSGQQIEEKSWKAKSLDDELRSLFAGRQEVVVRL